MATPNKGHHILIDYKKQLHKAGTMYLFSHLYEYDKEGGDKSRFVWGKKLLKSNIFHPAKVYFLEGPKTTKSREHEENTKNNIDYLINS